MCDKLTSSGSENQMSHLTTALATTLIRSGLTHSCSGPWYGFVCKHMLESFPEHRRGDFYYVGKNFGTIEIPVGKRGVAKVRVHDEMGNEIGVMNVTSDRMGEGEVRRDDKGKQIKYTYTTLSSIRFAHRTLVVAVRLG